ncbi:MAG: ribosomal-processing cysteine protease Prp [Candidatus Merdivicinus sp.]|jgi:uncharacterized protein YsxB (DUF464 family)
MIEAAFQCADCRVAGFIVSGHAGYANSGKDIVCAAVSSAVQLTANGITEILKYPAVVKVEGNAVSIQTEGDRPDAVQAMLDSFRLHMEQLAEMYPRNIKIRYLEV